MVIFGLLIPLIFIFASLCGVAVMLMELSKSRRAVFLYVIVAAMRRDIPLGPMVQAYAADCGGVFLKRQVNQIALALEAGKTLPQALRQAPGLLSPEEISVLNHVSSAHRQEEALEKLVEKRRSRQHLVSLVTDRLSTIFTSFLCTLIVLVVCNFAILPKITRIMFDFDIELPRSTKLLVSFSNDGWLFGLVALMMIVLLGISLLWLRSWPRSGATPLMLGDIASLVDAGRPVSPSLDRMIEAYGESSVGRIYAKVRHALSNGQTLAQSLRQAEVIDRPAADLLAAAEKVGNLSWACREVASAIERKNTARFRGLVELATMLLMIIVAGIVLFFALSYFVPLIHMIETMA